MKLRQWHCHFNTLLELEEQGGYFDDSAVMFEAVLPDQNKCVLCNTMDQDHK